ncbi:MAG: hypothetical protein JO112_20625, partial [Planctomycetes bacterium]|nr:hypothetical protein [Planctomycetota bacterium]
MKLDKEVLLKQRFWIGLGVLVVLVLGVLVVVMTTISSAVAEQQAAIDKAKSDLNGIAGQPKNQDWLKALDDRNQVAFKKKKEVWQGVADSQAAFMTWPDNLSGLNTVSFGSAISAQQGAIYVQDYPAQVQDLASVVVPVNDQGQGIVQFNGGSWQNVIQFVSNDQWNTGQAPSTEDVWLAQENLWLQKGLLLAIRDTNDNAATLQPLPGGKGSASFSNATWKLDLKINNLQLQGHLTNVGMGRQALGISFQVTFADNTPPMNLPADGEPLAPGQGADLVPVQLAQVASGIKGVKQNLDWRTAAVKRIDTISLFYPSSRTSEYPLIPDPVFGTATPAGGASGSPGGSGGGGGSLPNPFAGMTGGSGGGGAGGAGAAAANLSANGLQRNRYLEVTQTVRRAPVAVVVIVDPLHVEDFLTSLANSPLRIQTTQVDWQHFRGDIKPLVGADLTGTGTGAGPGGSGARPGGSGGPRPGASGGSFTPRPVGSGGGALPNPFAGRSGGSGGFTPPGARETGGGSSGAAGQVATEQPADLIQIAVYCTATLYEK